MNVLVLAGIIGFIIREVHKFTGLVWLWWRKEYRFDRMMIHLKTRQGVVVWGGPTHAILLLLVMLGMYSGTSSLFVILISLFGIFLGLKYLRNWKSWLIPKTSPKVLFLYLTILLFGVGFLAVSTFPILVSFAIFDLSLFPLSFLLVFLVSFPTQLYHRWVIVKAVSKLRHHKKMTVIGVTGSYGKTSVKDYLARTLEGRFQTIKTDASKNSPIGIAETLLSSLAPLHEVFVAEMAAYKPGEIKEMADMVRPEIGIVTAINPQHQDLFGSIENTVRAKYELIHSLVGRRLMIGNYDDTYVRRMGEMAEKEGCTVWWWTTKTESRKQRIENSSKLFRADAIVSDLQGTRFDCIFGDKKVHVGTQVLGEYQAGNILAAIAGGVACGMSLSEAANAAGRVIAARKVMEKKKGVNGSVFIDDTFNNNPDAAIAAIKFLATNKGKKILVFQPMIELGSFAESAHEEVGAFAAKYTDAIFLTNDNYFVSFERGVRRVNPKVPLMVARPQKAAELIKSTVAYGDMVLFKGKDAEHTLTRLNSV